MHAAREYLEGVLADLEAEAARVRYALAALGTETRPCPTPAPAGPAASSPCSPAAGTDLRTRLLWLLAEKGPLRGTAAARELGVSPAIASRALTLYPEFEKGPGGGYAPWRLTPAGRDAAAKLQASIPPAA